MLEPEIDTGGPMGRMILTVLGMVAEMELGFIRDRQRAGIDTAKAKGLYKGRPATFDRARIVALRGSRLSVQAHARGSACPGLRVHSSGNRYNAGYLGHRPAVIKLTISNEHSRCSGAPQTSS